MVDVPGEDGEGSGAPAFVRELCHELRQPLVVAMGYVSMLQDGSFGQLPAEAMTILHVIEGRLDALSSIVDGAAEHSVGA